MMEFPTKFNLITTDQGYRYGTCDHKVELGEDGAYHIVWDGEDYPYDAENIQQWIDFGWYTLEAI